MDRFTNSGTNTYYKAFIPDFLKTDPHQVLLTLILSGKSDNNYTSQQVDAWINQIQILQTKLSSEKADGYIIFEYTLVRSLQRIDVVLLIKKIVFSLEFKNWENGFKPSDAQQAERYGYDLKNYHEASENLIVCPILVATDATQAKGGDVIYPDNLFSLFETNDQLLMPFIERIVSQYGSSDVFNYEQWIDSSYKPSPNVIEAAEEIYKNNGVKAIGTTDADHLNISVTETKLIKLIDEARQKHEKYICFVTGVPGAGKTLVGLDIAGSFRGFDGSDRAVYLSGNGPLVDVIQESLARDAHSRKITKNGRQITLTEARSDVKAFIDMIYNYRTEALLGQTPDENIVIFDEAQRAWDKDGIKRFLYKHSTLTSRHNPSASKTYTASEIDAFSMSEPGLLISSMDKNKDWAVIICLVGLGQDIYKNEAEIGEWFQSVMNQFTNWKMFFSPELFNTSSEKGLDKKAIVSWPNSHQTPELHLSVSLRSPKAKHIPNFVDDVLDCKSAEAATEAACFGKYQIFVTRNLDLAKSWVKQHCNDEAGERCGLLASSSGARLLPCGIYTPVDLDVTSWFLNPSSDLRSSNFLEIAASEFKVQGLELDWSIVAWDADLRMTKSGWQYSFFLSGNWKTMHDETRIRYLRNAYRVLLTRSRKGFVIYVPQITNLYDKTRQPEYYDETYKYLKKCGIKDLPVEDYELKKIE